MTRVPCFTNIGWCVRKLLCNISLLDRQVGRQMQSVELKLRNRFALQSSVRQKFLSREKQTSRGFPHSLLCSHGLHCTVFPFHLLSLRPTIWPTILHLRFLPFLIVFRPHSSSDALFFLLSDNFTFSIPFSLLFVFRVCPCKCSHTWLWQCSLVIHFGFTILWIVRTV